MTEFIIVDDSTVSEAINTINAAPIVALDTETNKTDTMHTRYMLGWSAYVPAVDTAYYFEQRPLYQFTLDDITPARVVYHNGKFDRQVFKLSGYDMDNVPFDDTMLMSYIINEEPPHGLKELADKYIGLNSSQDQSVMKHLEKAFGWEGIPTSAMAKYAMMDTVLTYKLYEILAPKLLGLPKGMDIYEKDLKLSLILQRMEERGIKIDPVESRIKSGQCKQVMRSIKDQLGYDPAKPSQLGKRLYDSPPSGLGLKPIALGMSTKSFPNGRPKMGVVELEQHYHPEVGRVLEYRRVSKVDSSYYTAWPLLCDTDGRIHPTYHQHSTVTGRFSCSNPNMQQIPREGEGVKQDFPVKKLVRAEEGYEVWELDYSLQELRLASVYAQEETMLDTFRIGGDPHQMLADQLGVDRYTAKQCNFLLPYGGGAERLYITIKKLRPDSRLTFRDCQGIHANYHQKFPGFKAISFECMVAMSQHHYIAYWSGRRRRMKFDEHKAFNSLIQGGCADITRETLLRIAHENIPDTYLISQVHDSVWIETKDKENVERIQKIMEWPGDHFGIPFPVDIKRLV